MLQNNYVCFVFCFAQSSSIDLQLSAAVSRHDVITSWYVTHIRLTLLIFILFLTPSTVPFLRASGSMG
jgi:hypothetical protein